MGTHNSPETRLKISESNKGRVAWNKGKHVYLSEEAKMSKREKMKEILTGRKQSPERRLINSISQLGKKLSIETKFKISNATKGEKSHRWKGGITKINHSIRDGIESRLWKKAVFIRDNWTCKKCKLRNGSGKRTYLQSHHIKNFSKYPELRFTINNGITLCKKCHREFHKKYGLRNNTIKQIKEFLKEARKLIKEKPFKKESK